MSSPNAPVIAAIRSHHAQLAGDLRGLTAAVYAATGTGAWREARDRLGEWYRTELIPHAIAEEARLYALGEKRPETLLLVRGMLDEHRQLVALVADLALSRDALHACTTAVAAEHLFISHLNKENELLLPALDDAGVDLAAVLEGMHEILGQQAAEGQQSDGCGCGCGCGHGSEEHAAPAAVASGDDGDLDVRALPHGARHEIIFSRLDALAPGDELVIVNDHDPKPLRYQTAALWPDTFEWIYRESGPERWRVAIRRAG